MSTLIIRNEPAINKKYKKIFIILECITTFIILLLDFFALLQFKNVLNLNDLAVFISLCILYMCLTLIFCIVFIKFRRDIGFIRGIQSKESYKIFDIVWGSYYIILIIELFLVGALQVTSIERVKNIDFSKNCIETTAFVERIDKKINKTRSNDKTQYNAEFKYEINYKINNEDYDNYFKESTTNLDYEYKAEQSSPKYHKGDKLPIYVNSNDYNDFKFSLEYISDLLFYTLMSISIILTLLPLIYSIKSNKRFYNTDFLSEIEKQLH